MDEQTRQLFEKTLDVLRGVNDILYDFCGRHLDNEIAEIEEELNK